LLIDGLCPYLAYSLLIAYVPGISQIVALAIGAIFPATYGLVGIVRRRHLDIIGTVVLIGIAVSMAATFVGTGHDAAEIERFNALWQFPGARRLFRVLTIVWGLGWIGEFCLRVVMGLDALDSTGACHLAVRVQRHLSRLHHVELRVREPPAPTGPAAGS